MKEGKREASVVSAQCMCQGVQRLMLWCLLSGCFFPSSFCPSLSPSAFESHHVCLSASADVWHVYHSHHTPIKPCNNEKLNCGKHGWLTAAEIWCAIKGQRPSLLLWAISPLLERLREYRWNLLALTSFWRGLLGKADSWWSCDEGSELDMESFNNYVPHVLTKGHGLVTSTHLWFIAVN